MEPICWSTGTLFHWTLKSQAISVICHHWLLASLASSSFSKRALFATVVRPVLCVALPCCHLHSTQQNHPKLAMMESLVEGSSLWFVCWHGCSLLQWSRCTEHCLVFVCPSATHFSCFFSLWINPLLFILKSGHQPWSNIPLVNPHNLSCLVLHHVGPKEWGFLALKWVSSTVIKDAPPFSWSHLLAMGKCFQLFAQISSWLAKQVMIKQCSTDDKWTCLKAFIISFSSSWGVAALCLNIAANASSALWTLRNATSCKSCFICALGENPTFLPIFLQAKRVDWQGIALVLFLCSSMEKIACRSQRATFHSLAKLPSLLSSSSMARMAICAKSTENPADICALFLCQWWWTSMRQPSCLITSWTGVRLGLLIAVDQSAVFIKSVSGKCTATSYAIFESLREALSNLFVFCDGICDDFRLKFAIVRIVSQKTHNIWDQVIPDVFRLSSLFFGHDRLCPISGRQVPFIQFGSMSRVKTDSFIGWSWLTVTILF